MRLNIKDVNVDVLPQHQSAGKGTLLLVARLLERFEAGGRGTKVIGWRFPIIHQIIETFAIRLL